MNRIHLGPLATVDHQTEVEREVDSRASWTRPSAGEHSIFIPLHYERNYAYPLVVWLHDRGEDEARLNELMPALSLRNYIAVAPRGADVCAEGGFSWEQRPASVEWADAAIEQAIDDASRQFHVAPHRVFLAGEGAGGTMAFRIAFHRPQWFAGVLSINGSLPQGANPLARLNACRGVPVFWTHARQDDHFSEMDLGGQLRLLHCGGFNLTLRQYPAAYRADNILPDANRWMMDLVTRPAAVSS